MRHDGDARACARWGMRERGRELREKAHMGMNWGAAGLKQAARGLCSGTTHGILRAKVERIERSPQSFSFMLDLQLVFGLGV